MFLNYLGVLCVLLRIWRRINLFDKMMLVLQCMGFNPSHQNWFTHWKYWSVNKMCVIWQIILSRTNDFFVFVFCLIPKIKLKYVYDDRLTLLLYKLPNNYTIRNVVMTYKLSLSKIERLIKEWHVFRQFKCMTIHKTNYAFGQVHD